MYELVAFMLAPSRVPDLHVSLHTSKTMYVCCISNFIVTISSLEICKNCWANASMSYPTNIQNINLLLSCARCVLLLAKDWWTSCCFCFKRMFLCVRSWELGFISHGVWERQLQVSLNIGQTRQSTLVVGVSCVGSYLCNFHSGRFRSRQPEYVGRSQIDAYIRHRVVEPLDAKMARASAICAAGLCWHDSSRKSEI